MWYSVRPFYLTFTFSISRNQCALARQPPVGTALDDAVLAQKTFTDEAATIRRDWNTNAKYYVTDDVYQQQQRHQSGSVPTARGQLTIDRSAPSAMRPGFEYRVAATGGADDSAYYDEESATLPMPDAYRHHVYESPQFT